MKACDASLLGYAAAHHSFSGAAPPGASEWLRSQQPPPLTLRGTLLVAPDDGGVGNVMRVLAQYAVLGVLLQRAVYFELSETLREQFLPFLSSPLLSWVPPVGSRANPEELHEVFVSKYKGFPQGEHPDPAFLNKQGSNATIYYYLRLFESANLSAHLTAPVVRVKTDSSRVLPAILRNRYLSAQTPALRHNRHSFAACVSHLFLQPSQRTLGVAQPYLQRLHFPQPYRVVHLRLGDIFMTNRDPQYYKPAKDQRVRGFHQVNQITTCVAARLKNASGTFFLATDADSVVPQLRSRFGPQLVLTDGTAIHNRNNALKGKATWQAAIQKVWLDFFLLSLGRSLVITGPGRLSSFVEEAFARNVLQAGARMVRCQ